MQQKGWRFRKKSNAGILLKRIGSYWRRGINRFVKTKADKIPIPLSIVRLTRSKPGKAYAFSVDDDRMVAFTWSLFLIVLKYEDLLPNIQLEVGQTFLTLDRLIAATNKDNIHFQDISDVKF